MARRIRPGEPIGTEAQLVQQFGVNRSTVREGIRLLEQSGLIHRDSGRRLTASLPHYSRLATRMSRAMLLHEVTFKELWEATTALEIATVEQAAEHATADDIAELDTAAAAKMAKAHPGVIVGFKSAHFGGPGWESIEAAAKAGKETDLPVMVDFGYLNQIRSLPTLLRSIPARGARVISSTSSGRGAGGSPRRRHRCG